MRFVPSDLETYSTSAFFEVDPETEFSEQLIAVNALGSLALSKRDQRDQRDQEVIAFLGSRIRQAKPTQNDEGKSGDSEKASESKPKEVSVELSPQEADTLINALNNYVDLTPHDLEYFGIMRNYQAVSGRMIERKIASSMVKQIQDEFMLTPVEPTTRPMIGFGAVLSES
jgi:hypothetical protein